MKLPQNHDQTEEFVGELRRSRPFYRQWMMGVNPALFIERVIREYGDFVAYRGFLKFYIVNHPALVRQVLKGTLRDFDKNTRIYNHFRNVFGNGLATADGEVWRQKRKRLQPMFTPSAIDSYFALMLASTKSTVAGWTTAGPFDIAEEMNHLTLEIAGRAFFSDGFDNSIERIREWTEAINRYSAKPPIPLLSDLRFPSPTNLRVRRMMQDFRGFMCGLIASRESSAPQDDLLGVLLAARDEDGGQMGEDEICEEILGMIVGGHETSATALTWFWFELHHHPEVEEKILAEISRVVGEEELTSAHLRELSFTNSVLRETMRLHPPFWFENRNTIRDVELGGSTIQQGSMVVFSRYSLQRHPEFWENPNQFDPSRYDRENIAKNPGASCADMPFGVGPRVCIGRHFAMMELLVITVTILRRFHVAIHPSDRHRMSAKLTMAPRHGLQVTARQRS